MVKKLAWLKREYLHRFRRPHPARLDGEELPATAVELIHHPHKADGVFVKARGSALA
jgi:hypothetical protein